MHANYITLSSPSIIPHIQLTNRLWFFLLFLFFTFLNLLFFFNKDHEIERKVNFSFSVSNLICLIRLSFLQIHNPCACIFYDLTIFHCIYCECRQTVWLAKENTLPVRSLRMLQTLVCLLKRTHTRRSSKFTQFILATNSAHQTTKLIQHNNLANWFPKSPETWPGGSKQLQLAFMVEFVATIKITLSLIVFKFFFYCM